MTPRSGYTLPVFACAAAIAALRWLQTREPLKTVPIDLVHPPETVEIAIEQVAGLEPGKALAISRSDPGDNLDLTRYTPIWAMVELNPRGQKDPIVLVGGEGIGRHITVPHSKAGLQMSDRELVSEPEGVGDRQTDDSDTSPTQASLDHPAIYAYARELMVTNLKANLKQGLTGPDNVKVTIVLPQGRALAERTSNAAFGVVEGLSLLGTSGISHPLSSPEQLEEFRSQLRAKATQFETIVFCLGENGLDLAVKLGIPPQQRLKTANWLGPLLVEAALQRVKSVLLFGYHGKLIKLAGGIFHTHHHLADGRLEILTAHAAILRVPIPVLQKIFACGTVEEALGILAGIDRETQSNWVEQIYGSIVQAIDRRTLAYLHNHIPDTNQVDLQVGCVLFDRRRQIIARSPIGAALLNLLVSSK